jgi:glycine/D-amino acid oxidase-like deaminating enzyme
MEKKLYDVAVVGLGSHGSNPVNNLFKSGSCFYHLCKEGKTVLGIEQFKSPHTRGSHSGETRIVRESFYQHQAYYEMA